DGVMATTWLAPRGAGPSIIAEALGSSFRGSPRVLGASSALFHRALFLYAFGQSLHFAAWLRLVPELDRSTPVPKPLRRALAELAAELEGAQAEPAAGERHPALVTLVAKAIDEGGRDHELRERFRGVDAAREAD